MLIGRSSEADLSIKDQSLSRKHANLFYRNETLMIEDLDSHNGTRVNGRSIFEPYPLENDSVIEVGESRIKVKGLQEDGGTQPKRLNVRETKDGPSRTVYMNAARLLEETERAAADASLGESGSRRFIERLKLLNEAHHMLSHAIDLQSLLDHLVKWITAHMRPEEAAIFLKDDEGKLEPRATYTHSKNRHDVLYSTHLAEEVVEKGNAALVMDTEIDERFTGAVSIIASGVRSLLAAPLSDEESCVGMVVLSARGMVRHFSEEDMEMLVSIASVAALRIRNLALTEEAAERRRLEEELSLARRIQEKLLPGSLPQINGYAVFGETIPSQQVSGDFFQVMPRLGGRECVFLVADVSGKGMAASLLTASLEALSAAPIEDGRPPEAICSKVSRMLVKRTPPEKYATAFLAILDPATGRVDYTNAGHNPAIHIKNGGEIEWLENTGLPLGLWTRGSFSAKDIHMEPGDLLVMYSDGWSEAHDDEGREFSMERLGDLCAEHRGLEPDALAEELKQAIAEFTGDLPNSDDQTLVLLKRNP